MIRIPLPVFLCWLVIACASGKASDETDGGSFSGDASGDENPLTDGFIDGARAASDGASEGASSREDAAVDVETSAPGTREAGDASIAGEDASRDASVERDAQVDEAVESGGRNWIAKGDTLPDLQWRGYVNDSAEGLATLQDLTDYSVSALQSTGRSLVLVHLSEFDCPGCRSAAMDLARLGPEIVAAGGAVVEVLGSAGFFFPSDLTHLDAWVESFDLTVTTVIDAPGYDLQTLDAFGIRETTVIVDLSTREVIWQMNGDPGGTEPSSIVAASDEMLRLLTR